MRNFIRKHIKKVCFILVIFIICATSISVAYFIKYNNDIKNLENKYRAIIVTYNPITGAIVPIEYFYFESSNNEKVIYFKGIADSGKIKSAEIYKQYIIMVSTEEINTQLKEISK